MVAFGPVRRAVCGDQPADRGKTGGARGRRAGLTRGGPGMDERTAQRGDDGEADSIRLSSGVRPPASWRTPAVILACGCLIAMIGFGARSGLGFFLTPMSSAHGWGRDVFALALAIQMLLWGAAQPVAGALADRYGATPVLSAGAVLYALGLAAMAYAATPGMLHLTAGAVIGFGLAGSSFTIVIGAFGKLMPPQWRSFAFGAGTAAGSFRAIPVLAARGGAHRSCRLAGHARHLRRRRASHHAAVARARSATAGRRACSGEQSAAAIGGTGAQRGARPQELCAARPRFLHLRLPDLLHRRASAGLSGRPRPAVRGRRLDARQYRPIQHRGCHRRRLAR